MKVKCLNNTGEALREYEYNALEKDVFGRFGVTAYGSYNELTIGEAYQVMGIIIFETYQAYLIDGEGFIVARPCPLFEIIDDEVSPNWHFRSIEKDEEIYPFIQAIFGYPELCSDKQAYEKLIVERDESAMRIYFRRKLELEKS